MCRGGGGVNTGYSGTYLLPFSFHHPIWYPVSMDLTTGDLAKILDSFSPDKRLKVLYLRKANQLWQYKIVNVSEDELGVNLIIESARKLASDGR